MKLLFLRQQWKESPANDVAALISSHDLNYVTEVCDRILPMKKGLIIRTNEASLREPEEYSSVGQE